MKFTTKLGLALLIGTSFLYTACKKDQTATKSTTTTTTTPAQNGAIAVNLYKALAGQYGGASINTGINTPATLGVNHNSRVLQSTSTLCGYVIDTTFSNTATAHDTTTTTSGLFKFVYKCQNGTVNGYTLKDSIATASKGANFSNTTIVEQNYTSLASAASLKLFLIDGQIYSVVDNQTLKPAASVALGQEYILSSLVIDNTSPIADILSGTASFIVESDNNGQC